MESMRVASQPFALMREHNRRPGLCVIITAFLLSFLICGTSYACTAFCVIRDSNCVLAKNLDWPIGDGLVLVNKRGLYKEAYINSPKKLAWTSKYGSVTFNQFGKEFPLGGMNETGLVVEELNSWGQPPVNESAYPINELQWVQYCLDNFSSIEEIIEMKDSVLVEPLFLNLHYLIADSRGNILIVEFYEGVSHFISGDEVIYPVLSNNHYDQSIRNIQNFKGFGGNMEATSDSSGDRFVRAASMVRDISDSVNIEDQAFGILDAVKQHDTQWSILYDIKSRLICFRTINDQSVRIIHVSDCDFSCNAQMMYVNVNQALDNNGHIDFKTFTDHENEVLLTDVCRKYENISPGEKVKDIFSGLMNYGNGIKCR